MRTGVPKALADAEVDVVMAMREFMRTQTVALDVDLGGGRGGRCWSRT